MRDLLQEYDYVVFSHDKRKASWNWEVNAYNEHPTRGYIHVGYGVGQDMAEAYDRFRTNEDRRPKKRRKR